ncbi:alpha/beta fold hydrolase [Ovoidimarina sediminis]|uniref:alpha/beta fold hydrolase n=1 Tax=Ovoidimarina sediminis TaxID=3079856 RepID=UPI0029060248|nr:alpha/beta hydrolase [Rhodophyticola sp. MJ-SS7]MDU8943132.1 alpha/beta hydrolase [Rhodophyticola sp. MJ-SS7]
MEALRPGGKRLEARRWGPGDGLQIVMLHEGLGSVGLWRDTPERLAEATGLGVLAYSRAGYGRSDPADLPRPLDYMTREATEVLPQVLDAAGIDRAILMGHSDGATIAAIHAGSVEDHRVRGLILIAPHFFTEEMGLAEIARAKEAYETGDLRARLARHHDHPDIAFRGWNDAWLDPGFRDWSVAEVIDYLRIPILAIQGTADPYGTRAQIDELAARSYAPVDVVMPEGAGHAPHHDRAEETLAAITDFTRRLARIEAAGPVPA